MSQMVLNISLCTMDVTTFVIKQALETVRYIELEAWSFQVFGQSMLSKRKTAFSTLVVQKTFLSLTMDSLEGQNSG